MMKPKKLQCSGITETCTIHPCVECALRDCPYKWPGHYDVGGCETCKQIAETTAQGVEQAITHFGADIWSGIQAAEALVDGLYRLVAPSTPLLCQYGTTCNQLAIGGFTFCESHKCATKGCTNPRHRFFHHCEVHP